MPSPSLDKNQLIKFMNVEGVDTIIAKIVRANCSQIFGKISIQT